MKYQILFVMICFITFNVQARQVITGILTDKETTKPIETATIELLQLPDSSSIESTTSNSEGSFMLYKTDTAKTYCLRIKHVSYKMKILKIPKKIGSMINNIGTITMEPAFFNLKEVVVNGSKIKVMELSDRTVYGIPSELKKTSTDGLDVLRKVPAIQVDYLNENITVEGKTNIRIEVDGVTRDKEYLKKLHPSQIEKLEVITSPSGKYDADVDAVINVITNKEMRYGFKGNINVRILPKNQDNYISGFNGSLDYGMKKISYYIAANGGTQRFKINNSLDRFADTTSLKRNGIQKNQFSYGNVNAGFIYDPNEFNNLNFNVSYNKNEALNDGDNFNFNSVNNIMKNIYESTTNADNKGGGLTTSLFYKHKFDKTTQHGYEIEASYYNSLNNDNYTKYQNINYDTNMTETSRNPYQSEKNITNRQTISSQANYTLPFDSVYTFCVGIGGNYNQYNINNISSLTNAPNMDYQDMRGNGFADLAKNFKKGNIKIGSRVETSYITINSANHSNYLSLLPYANGQYKFNDKKSIKLSYSRRVIRPSSDQLNPFESMVDSLTRSKGNINLKPAYRDNFQLTYNIKYGKSKFSGSLSPQVFYEYKQGLIQNITQYDATTKFFERMPENVSNGYESGFGLSVNSQIFMLMFYSNFRYSFNHIDQYQNQINATNKQGWNWNSYVMSPLPKNFKLFAVFNINGPSINGQEQTQTSPFYIIGLVKQFKNNSSVNVLVFNPFADKIFENKTTLNSTAFHQTSDSYLHLQNGIMINYTYNFKVGKNINLEKHDEQNNEENGTKLPF